VAPLRNRSALLVFARVRDDESLRSPDGGFEPEGARGVYKVRDGGVHAPRDRGAPRSIRSELMKAAAFLESELNSLSQLLCSPNEDFQWVHWASSSWTDEATRSGPYTESCNKAQ
jgi:hypothetical protein